MLYIASLKSKAQEASIRTRASGRRRERGREGKFIGMLLLYVNYYRFIKNPVILRAFLLFV